MSIFERTNSPGILLQHGRNGAATGGTAGVLFASTRKGAIWQQGGAHALAFAGIYLFTLLLYLRPNEIFPGVFGTIPIIKMVATITPLLYFASKVSRSEPLTIWPVEVKMVFLIAALGVLMAPFAVAPDDSIEVLTDTYLKIVLIFTLMVNLLDSRDRLLSILNLVLAGGTFIALSAIMHYLAGDFGKEVGGVARIEGVGGGMFSNPNDLATALAMLMPLAVVLGFTRRGMARLVYFGCALLLAIGVIVTLSRTGFMGLMALGVVLWWKLSRGRRIRYAFLALLISGVFLAAMPGGYGRRVVTIFNPEEDTTGSAQERTEVLKRALNVAIARPVIGVGMGNFHIYSVGEVKAHNSYLEISAELGVGGLLAYLILLFAPLKSLRRIEHKSRGAAKLRELHLLSIGMQATFVAYLVCSFFSSIQYQWYIYYPVAYAISLRTLYGRETGAEKARASAGNEETGLIWRADKYQGEAALWAGSGKPGLLLRSGEEKKYGS